MKIGFFYSFIERLWLKGPGVGASKEWPLVLNWLRIGQHMIAALQMENEVNQGICWNEIGAKTYENFWQMRLADNVREENWMNSKK